MFEVIDASGLITVQDLGRRGFQQFGVPVSGPMDWFAHRAANQLVGNQKDAAALEIGLGEVALRAHKDCVIAVTGAGYEVVNYVWTFSLWTSFYVRAGWVVEIKKIGGGNWAYLAVAGGFVQEKIMGSHSGYVRGNIGEAISTGTRLPTGKPAQELSKLAARDFPVQKRPAYSQTPIIDVISGPQQFSKESLRTFFESEYSLSPSFDRMGYRLAGAAIERDATELISEGMTMGSVQIPANGQPIVIMADSPTTGGYPKIATVTRASLPLFAHCETGKSKIRFREVPVQEAQDTYRTMIKGLLKDSHED